MDACDLITILQFRKLCTPDSQQTINCELKMSRVMVDLFELINKPENDLPIFFNIVLIHHTFPVQIHGLLNCRHRQNGISIKESDCAMEVVEV